MQLLLRILPFILVAVAWNYLKAEKASRPNRVYYQRLYLWVGTMLALICLGAIFFIYADSNGTEAAWVAIDLMFFALVGLILILLAINWQISYDDNQFKYRTIFRKEYTFSFHEITRVKRTKYSIYLYTSRKRLHIDIYALGIDEFFETMNRAKHNIR